MGKRIIQQRRGRGTSTYRAHNNAFSEKVGYSNDLKDGETWEVVKLISSPGHSVPLAKLRSKEGKVFVYFAPNGLFEGQKITIGGKSRGDIARIGDLPNGTKIFNIESKPKDGGKFVRSGGSNAEILAKRNGETIVWLPSKKEKKIGANCRVTVGVAAGEGRVDKPILKAGKMKFIKGAKSKLWPRTSALKMNAIDHPFGSGRGKRIKSKIVKRMSSPGQKVGLLKPRRTGRKKR